MDYYLGTPLGAFSYADHHISAPLCVDHCAGVLSCVDCCAHTPCVNHCFGKYKNRMYYEKKSKVDPKSIIN